MTRKTWRCFHCEEVFTDVAAAREHFGRDQGEEPGCLLRMQPGDAPLLTLIRKLQDELSEVRYQLCEGDSATDRRMFAMSAEYHTALIREEEKGYARGLRDARLYPAEVAAE
jgi:hypothetical protein